MSNEGQDLRMPVLGGTRFPTDDSKQYARQLLSKSKKSAEVGPAPTVQSLKPPGPTLQEIAPKSSSSTVGSLPKIGAAIMKDPLIEYLRKEAKQLDDNLTAMPTGKEEKSLTSESPMCPDAQTKADEKVVAPTKELFDNTYGVNHKLYDHDFQPKAGGGNINKHIQEHMPPGEKTKHAADHILAIKAQRQ